MRYYEIPDRMIADPVTGDARPTRVSRFSGGPESTRFTDPTTGEVFVAIRVRGVYRPDGGGGPVYDPPPGWSATPDRDVDFRYPVDPGLKYRVRKDGTIRPIGWKAVPK